MADKVLKVSSGSYNIDKSTPTNNRLKVRDWERVKISVKVGDTDKSRTEELIGRRLRGAYSFGLVASD